MYICILTMHICMVCMTCVLLFLSMVFCRGFFGGIIFFEVEKSKCVAVQKAFCKLSFFFVRFLRPKEGVGASVTCEGYGVSVPAFHEICVLKAVDRSTCVVFTTMVDIRCGCLVATNQSKSCK
jgi:hypothetical protein